MFESTSFEESHHPDIQFSISNSLNFRLFDSISMAFFSDRPSSLVQKFCLALQCKHELSFGPTPWLIPNEDIHLFLLFSTCWCWCHTSVRSVSGLSGTLLLSVGRNNQFCHAIPIAELVEYGFRLPWFLLYLLCLPGCRLQEALVDCVCTG